MARASLSSARAPCSWWYFSTPGKSPTSKAAVRRLQSDWSTASAFFCSASWPFWASSAALRASRSALASSSSRWTPGGMGLAASSASASSTARGSRPKARTTSPTRPAFAAPSSCDRRFRAGST